MLRISGLSCYTMVVFATHFIKLQRMGNLGSFVQKNPFVSWNGKFGANYGRFPMLVG